MTVRFKYKTNMIRKNVAWRKAMPRFVETHVKKLNFLHVGMSLCSNLLYRKTVQECTYAQICDTKDCAEMRINMEQPIFTREDLKN